ncbi:MAG: CPBP family intramembrane glutamic endopeptidase [Phycisphaerales bacterium JB041]
MLFVVGPMVYVATAPGTGALFPALWAWAVFSLLLLLRDRSFDRREFWNGPGLRRSWWPMLARFIVLGGLLTLAVWILTPDRLFDLPRRKPGLWLAIMVLYPLFSVFPQEVIFRAFLFQRYRRLVGNGAAMVLLSAAAFGWVHIVFAHWISVVLTLIGGLVFARTFAETRSVAAASVEHSLYGCLVFTVGLNSYFYTGAAGG